MELNRQRTRHTFLRMSNAAEDVCINTCAGLKGCQGFTYLKNRICLFQLRFGGSSVAISGSKVWVKCKSPPPPPPAPPPPLPPSPPPPATSMMSFVLILLNVHLNGRYFQVVTLFTMGTSWSPIDFELPKHIRHTSILMRAFVFHAVTLTVSAVKVLSTTKGHVT